MRTWWVNHKQTFEHEFEGGYVWCPKRKKDGSLNHFYETVREVRPGDLVLSYANAAVQGWGVARTHAQSCPKPDEFGRVGMAWNDIGWRVDVQFKRFRAPLRVADHLDALGALIPERYSPIRRNGHGNQGAYFAEVPSQLARAIIALAEPLHAASILGLAAGDTAPPSFEVDLPAIREWEEKQVHEIQEGSTLPQTEREALVLARVGQGRFKEAVARFEHACRITGVRNPTHLVASHIKPWRESDNTERLHAGNGLLLTPSIDHLFDRGFISFEDGGDLIVSPIADPDSLQRMGVCTDRTVIVGTFNSDQRHFLDYHRRQILLKSAG